MLPLNFQNMLNVQINVNKSFANIKPVNSRSWKPYTKYSHTASPLPCGFDFNSSISQAASCRCPRFPRLSAIAINYPLSSQTVHIIRFTAHFQSMCVYHACKKKSSLWPVSFHIFPCLYALLFNLLFLVSYSRDRNSGLGEYLN